jgi:hypothetical protein
MTIRVIHHVLLENVWYELELTMTRTWGFKLNGKATIYTCECPDRDTIYERKP